MGAKTAQCTQHPTTVTSSEKLLETSCCVVHVFVTLDGPLLGFSSNPWLSIWGTLTGHQSTLWGARSANSEPRNAWCRCLPALPHARPPRARSLRAGEANRQTLFSFWNHRCYREIATLCGHVRSLKKKTPECGPVTGSASLVNTSGQHGCVSKWGNPVRVACL